MSDMTRPWLNNELPHAERIQLLLQAMSFEEKVAQMLQISSNLVSPAQADEWAARGAGSFLHTLGNDARRVQRMAVQSRLGIPLIFGIDAVHGHTIHNGATVFPSQLALASSFSPETVEKMAEVTAREVAAEGLHWTFAPVLCLGRDLRWGRIDETFGEDTFLTGVMGAAAIRGFQGDDVSAPDRIIACAKHYIAYGESTGGRDSYDAPVSMRNLRSIFLPPFEEAVKAGCLTFMAGYESVDGTPCSASKKLLRGLLKEELNFDGFVVTDWTNVTSMYMRQRVAADVRDASRIALESGNDMIMVTPEFFESILSLHAEGKINPALVDEAVRRILSVKFKAGLFDVPEKVKTLSLEEDPSVKESAAIFGCEKHLAASLDAARKSMVLLKNGKVGDAPSLPLSDRKIRTIVVTGPNADSVRAQLGDWGFFTHPDPHLDAVPEFHVTTMLEGITEIAERRGMRVLFDKGCDIFDEKKESIKKACSLAAKSDVVIAVLGDTLLQTGEIHDRSDLALSGAQNRLVKELRKICDRKKIPLVLLLVNGKPLEFGCAAECADAILETFNSGTLGGRAAAEIVFGEVEPQGRLPISFPRKTGQLPVYYNQLPGWHADGYIDCPASPLFAFGEGLGYTDFAYESIALSKTTARAGERVEVRVKVSNKGSRRGVETVQLYVSDRVASVVPPVRELKAFTQISLEAGASAEVVIPLQVDSLSLIDCDENRVLEPGDFEIAVGHDSRKESQLSAVLTVI